MVEVVETRLDDGNGNMIQVIHRRTKAKNGKTPLCYLGHEPVFNDYAIVPDANIFLENGDGFVETLNKEHPGKVWLTEEIRREMEELRALPKEERPNIRDYNAFLGEMYRNTSLLSNEPFSFPEYKNLGSCGEKGERAAKELEELAKASSSRDRGAKEPSDADKSLLIGPVYGNGNFKYKWVIMSEDRRVICMADTLNREGYGVVFARSMEDISHYVREFL